MSISLHELHQLQDLCNIAQRCIVQEHVPFVGFLMTATSDLAQVQLHEA